MGEMRILSWGIAIRHPFVPPLKYNAWNDGTERHLVDDSAQSAVVLHQPQGLGNRGQCLGVSSRGEETIRAVGEEHGKFLLRVEVLQVGRVLQLVPGNRERPFPVVVIRV